MTSTWFKGLNEEVRKMNPHTFGEYDELSDMTPIDQCIEQHIVGGFGAAWIRDRWVESLNI